MTNKPGQTTSRRGWKHVKEGLFTPQVIAIIGLTVALQIGVIIGTTALVRALGIRTSTTLTAFTLGVFVATTVLVLSGVVAVLSGGVNWITGSKAEEWTGEALAAFGPGWRVLHNLPFEVGKPPYTWPVDVDHVAVGASGVLVVESKYSSVPINLDAERLSSKVRKDAAQAEENVSRVKRVIGSLVQEVPVTPVLVYWGFRITRPKVPIRNLGRVRIVVGADASRWRATFLGQTIGRETENAVWETLKEYQSSIPRSAESAR